MKKLFALAALSIAVAACSEQQSDDGMPLGDPGYEEELMAQLLDAQPGDVITIPEGKFPITRSLSLTVDGVTIRGAGMDKSILSFAGQVSGAEGLLVTASDFTIEGLAIEDTIGDALKISEGNNSSFVACGPNGPMAIRPKTALTASIRYRRPMC